MIRSIRTRLTVACISLALGPLLVVSLVHAGLSLHALRTEALAHQRLAALHVGHAVEAYIGELVRVLDLTTEAHAFRTLSISRREEILSEVLAFDNRFEDLLLAGSDGRVLVHRHRIRVILIKPGTERVEDPLLERARVSGQRQFGPVFFDAVTGEPLMGIALPLRDLRSGAVDQILLASVRLKKLWQLLADLADGENALYIADAQGRIIGHSDPSVALRGQQVALPIPEQGVDADGRPILSAYCRVCLGDQELVVAAQRQERSALALTRQVLSISATVSLLALAVAVGMAVLIIGSITRPLSRLSDAARLVQGDASQTPDFASQRDDEVGELGRAFAAMTGRLQATIKELEHEVTCRRHEIEERERAEQHNAELAERLRQAHKMEALGTLAGGIAHDFNNILAIIIGYADLVRRRSVSYHHELDHVLAAGERARSLVARILAFTRQVPVERVAIDLAVLIQECRALLEGALPATIALVTELEACAPVLGDRTQLNQVIMNICTNASHAMRAHGGHLRIALHEVCLVEERALDDGRVLPAGRYAELVIEDQGCGIPPAIIDRIFDPYFTTKEQGDGSGLGLSIVHGIITACGGDIQVTGHPGPGPGQGACFTILLPVVVDQVATAVERSQAHISAPKRGRLLIVDDETAIVDMLTQSLGDLGYETVACTDSEAAWARFDEDAMAFDAVITDMTMPRLDGARLAARICARRPELPIILCTGYTDRIDEAGARALGLAALLHKPITTSVLVTTLQRCLSGKASRP